MTKLGRWAHAAKQRLHRPRQHPDGWPARLGHWLFQLYPQPDSPGYQKGVPPLDPVLSADGHCGRKKRPGSLKNGALAEANASLASPSDSAVHQGLTNIESENRS